MINFTEVSKVDKVLSSLNENIYLEYDLLQSGLLRCCASLHGCIHLAETTVTPGLDQKMLFSSELGEP